MDDLTHQELITQYVLELKGKSVCLPFQDYQVIQGWIDLSQGHYSKLFDVLQEVLPQFLQDPDRKVKNLKSIDTKVKKLIQNG